MNIRRMTLFVVLLVTVVLLHNSAGTHCGRDGAAARKNISISKQQQQKQTPPIKIIHTRNGDIIDCVDINKQPAFDNPRLKTHKIQMQPSFVRERKAVLNSAAAMAFQNVKFDQLQECPQGTVPIPRMLKRKEDSEPNGLFIPPLIPLVRHYEVVETDDGDKHYGVKGSINANNPSVEPNQLSSAQIWVQSGPPENFNLIEAGWVVYPRYFGDNHTHLYTSWSGIGGDHKHCINYLCLGASSGFVQVNPKLYLGIKLNKASVYGGDIYVMHMEITQDRISGDWWLTIHDETVGYWPKELFSYLANNAGKVGFGAVTGAPANSPSPQMGNGHLPDVVDLTRCGFIARMKVIDIQGNENDINAEQLRIVGEESPCYEQYFRGFVDNNFQITTTFGGPGGTCG